MGALLDIGKLTLGIPSGEAPFVLLHDVSLRVEEGECVALAGESGAGKTLTLLAVIGLLPSPIRVLSGRIMFRGRPLVGMCERHLRAIRGSEIGMIFQNTATALNPVLAVGPQAAEGLRAGGKVGKRAAKERVLDLFEKLRLPEPERLWKAYPHELSGGMQRRILLASVLACRPRLILADEPSTGLDACVETSMWTTFEKVRRESGASLVLVSHHLQTVARVADRLCVFKGGRIVEQGGVDSILRRPAHPYTAALAAAGLSRARNSLFDNPGRGEEP